MTREAAGPVNPSSPFSQRLWTAAQARGSWVCLGLDVDLARLPESLPRTLDGARRFLHDVIDASVDEVVAYKPNLPFYLALGSGGLELLADTVRHVSGRAIVIVDGKFSDVATTTERYVYTMFEYIGCDAVVINPYGGRDAIAPFLTRPERGAFVWTRGSNPGADELQGQRMASGDPLFIEVARGAAGWNGLGNVGLVVGATRAGDIRDVRAAAPGLPILAPGVGAQGGDLEATVAAGFGQAPAGVLISVGRSALWASGAADYAKATRRGLSRTRERIEAVIGKITA